MKIRYYQNIDGWRYIDETPDKFGWSNLDGQITVEH